jgi:hypothetical protein
MKQVIIFTQMQDIDFILCNVILINGQLYEIKYCSLLQYLSEQHNPTLNSCKYAQKYLIRFRAFFCGFVWLDSCENTKIPNCATSFIGKYFWGGQTSEQFLTVIEAMLFGQ